ncbi:hypothetical protein Pedsa_0958 [Pseudopedobacter saltans DSM 12145]|uniref:HTH araC/xylS-type domain-containing protein n=1 Tax=Pseudopedobacter saltans (strain ATCC 51119 / DSM 12145 / JCM 21818 / CCUG 39354 / LMG 10337 / NBRC 100064 / NCIMB 13643) TaxID=762903 RepID=F0SAT5_PSESL|nr:hypothetical protein [Pseudopedobacter saltans]ADY51530.1 hypothetical protein Pedsa_0958 [Pseudopedobacter saltans DSM 12145]
MAYHRTNYLKKVSHIMAVYQEVKEPDIPDTKIVAKVFPKHNIYISYRQWMNLKGLKPSEYKNQLSLF